MSEEFWIALIGTAGGVVSVYVAQLVARSLNNAKVRNIDADTITKLIDQVDELIADREKNRNAVELLRREFTRYKRQVRGYFQELMDHLDKMGISDYPDPPPGLMDTQELKTHDD